MRIEALHIHDFRALAEVRLDGLPADGMIVITGSNESGKSTVAEAMLFALYGRGLQPDAPITSLVRWGRDRLCVMLQCRLPNGHCRIQREVNRLGEHTVVLERLDAPAGKVSGLKAVRLALSDMGLASFETFSRILYVRGGAESGGERQAIVSEAAGIGVLERAVQQLQGHVAGREREFALLMEDVDRKKIQMEKQQVRCDSIAGSADALKDLDAEYDGLQADYDAGKQQVKQHRKVAKQLQRRAKRLDGLDQEALASAKTECQLTAELFRKRASDIRDGAAPEAWTAAEDGLTSLTAMFDPFEACLDKSGKALSGKRDLAGEHQGDREALEGRLKETGRGQRIFLGLTLLAWMAGLALAWLAIADHGWLPFSEIVAAPQGLHYLVAGFAVLGFLSFCLFFRCVVVRIGVGRNLQGAVQRSDNLSDEIKDLESALEEGRQSFGAWPAVMARLSGGADPSVSNPMEAAGKLAENCRHMAGALRSAAEALVKDQQARKEDLRKLRARRDRVRNEWQEKKTALDQMDELKTAQDALHDRADVVQGKLDTEMLALELLENTKTMLSYRLPAALGVFLRRFAGPFTANRFRELRMTADGDLQAFSAAKGDFLSLHELSDSAGAGLRLSLRIAAAAMLSGAQFARTHCLWVDGGAFAGLDADRRHMALAGLSGCPDFSQVFVFMDHVPEGIVPDMTCPLNRDDSPVDPEDSPLDRKDSAMDQEGSSESAETPSTMSTPDAFPVTPPPIPDGPPPLPSQDCPASPDPCLDSLPEIQEVETLEGLPSGAFRENRHDGGDEK